MLIVQIFQYRLDKICLWLTELTSKNQGFGELMTKLTELIKSNKKLKEINQSRKDLILRDSSTIKIF